MKAARNSPNASPIASRWTTTPRGGSSRCSASCISGARWMARLPSSVLFACTLNSIRSPMAAALMRKLHGKRVFIDSVGVRTAPVDPFAVAVMAEIGIDLQNHQPKSFDELEDTSFDLVVSLSPDAQHTAVERTRSVACEVEFWPVLD